MYCKVSVGPRVTETGAGMIRTAQAARELPVLPSVLKSSVICIAGGTRAGPHKHRDFGGGLWRGFLYRRYAGRITELCSVRRRRLICPRCCRRVYGFKVFTNNKLIGVGDNHRRSARMSSRVNCDSGLDIIACLIKLDVSRSAIERKDVPSRKGFSCGGRSRTFKE